MNRRMTIALTLLHIVSALPAHGDNNEVLSPYPLRCDVEIYPRDICFGDLVFVSVTLKNGGDLTVVVPERLPMIGPDLANTKYSLGLVKDGEMILEWRSPGELTERERMMHSDGICLAAGHSLRPGETIEIGYRPVWVPLPEFANSGQSKNLRNGLDSGGKEFLIEGTISLRGGNLVGRMTEEPCDQRGYPRRHLLNGVLPGSDGGHSISSLHNVHGGTLKIRPRSGEELALLQDWFLEIPETVSPSAWYVGGVFAHLNYVRESPFVPATSLQGQNDWRGLRHEMQDIWSKRIAHADDCRNFFFSMKTRTPEVGERIARTKELERQLLERAERPESTISPMMKEFIILRGHLVDVRYATDGETRDEAFGSMLEWIDQTEHRGLWTKYLSEIVLGEFSRPDIVPDEFLNAYRLKLAALRERTPNGEQR